MCLGEVAIKMVSLFFGAVNAVVSPPTLHEYFGVFPLDLPRGLVCQLVGVADADALGKLTIPGLGCRQTCAAGQQHRQQGEKSHPAGL